jgi:hypothetical protein
MKVSNLGHYYAHSFYLMQKDIKSSLTSNYYMVLSLTQNLQELLILSKEIAILSCKTGLASRKV